MFTKILIANRGEIACRIAATARRLGIATVAVYSDADATSRHVADCDDAFHIGAAEATASYLCADKIISAALRSGAQAVHPGYGFLSENAAFAEACDAAGLIFIGPPVAAIRAMGSKSAAKTLMEKAGVPLVPGYHGVNQDADFLQLQADAIGYPVLLKASAGGGGKGMRIVEARADFSSALASCQREARNSFGDDTVLIEKYLCAPRHIEMQIFADAHSGVIHLFERDCSVQRRHQKVLEEAPAPGMTDARRSAMGDAAIAAARAVNYVGAGTVEFIVDQDGTFYFMEMNTRLQVEHPVTEMITGIDLVEWQLRIAAGEALPLQQSQVTITGHALEARIYAEHPESGFLPSIGTLHHLRTPAASCFAACRNAQQTSTIRIDSGVREGDTISPFYDPMIAKLIVWGSDREAALRQMHDALQQYQVAGVATNIDFLARLVGSAAFTTAQLDTGLIEKNHAVLFPIATTPALHVLALAVAALLHAEQSTDHADPWTDSDGWRMNHALQRVHHFSADAHLCEVQITYRHQGWSLQCLEAHEDISAIRVDGRDITLRVADRTVQCTVARADQRLTIFCDGCHHVLDWVDPLAHAGSAEVAAGQLTAPMPGKIIAVLVDVGTEVERGTPLLIMEAMKMEHTITAPHAGVVAQVLYRVGDQVAEGVALLTFEATLSQ